MSKTGLPDKWAKRLVAKGFVDPRYKHDVPSMSALSTATGLHTSTISDLIAGRRKATVESVQALVAALGDDVAGWLGVAVRERFVPPPEADLLTTRQRKAITELIRSFVAADQEELMGNADQHPAATRKPGSRPDLRVAKAARTGEPELRKRRRQHDEATETPPEDPTGMEPL